MTTSQSPQGSCYRVPAGYGEAEFVEKRSRFIGRVWHAASEEEAKARITAIQKQHFDATHNVYAYIITPTLMRFSDDDEPQGTAGMPTLHVLEQEELLEICCVVTRYYGGILLGAGGLVRAYAKAAKLAIEAAGILTMRLWDQLHFTCPYALYDQIKALTANSSGIVDSTDFSAEVTLTLFLPATETDTFILALQALSAGTIQTTVQDTLFMGK